MISPALGTIPRPEWSDPFAVKHGDIAVVGGVKVVLPHPATGAPGDGARR